MQKVEKPKFGTSEALGILAAIVILLLAFGSVIAMVLPVVTAIVAVATSFGLLDLLSHRVTVPSFAPELAALVGLGVGIDYALFVVTRYRSARDTGAAPEDAVVTAMATSGRAVVSAGSTVVLSLLGLFLLGLPFDLRGGAGRGHRRPAGHDRIGDAAAGRARFRQGANIDRLRVGLRVQAGADLARLLGVASGGRGADGCSVTPRWPAARRSACCWCSRYRSSRSGWPLPTRAPTRPPIPRAQAYDLIALKGFGPGTNGPWWWRFRGPGPAGQDRAAMARAAQSP